MIHRIIAATLTALAILINVVTIQAQIDTANHDSVADFLRFEEGIWDATLTFYVQPDTPPQTFKAEQTDVIGCCGKWLITDLKLVDDGDNPPPPYSGHGVLGYDSSQQKFVGSWVDSRQEAIGNCEGSLDEKTNTLTLTVKTANAPTVLFVTRKLDENRKQLEILVANTSGGEDQLAAVIDYQRRNKR